MMTEDDSVPDEISAPLFEPGDQRYQSDCNDALRDELERLRKAAALSRNSSRRTQRPPAR